MQSIIDMVSDVIVKKLLSNGSFVDKLADTLMLNGVLDNVKQSVYEENQMDNKQTYATVTAIENRLSYLRIDNLVLADEVDALEQYSRCDCLLLHGISESEKEAGHDGCHTPYTLRRTSGNFGLFRPLKGALQTRLTIKGGVLHSEQDLEPPPVSISQGPWIHGVAHT